MRKTKRFAAILLAAVLLGGCGSQVVPQEEYDKVVAERDELQEENERLQKKYDTAVEDLASLQASITMDEIKNEVEKEKGPSERNEDESSAESKETSNGDVEILADYTLPDSIGWYTMRFMVVKNNSSETVDISTSSLAYAEDGTMLAADDASFEALGAGCTSVFYEAFETDGKIDYYETDMKSQKSRYYESIIQDLSFVQNDIKDGAVFQVTNNGEDAAEFVEGYALFFLNGELVYYDSTYFTDDDSEIKPGATISKQMTSYEQFDTIEFYLTGRK